MKTNFFENIANLQIPGKWNIAIHADEKGNLTVSTLFTGMANGDTASKQIPPLIAKGTAQELDEGYFDLIEDPIRQTAGLISNMDEYLKGLSKAKENSKMVQDNKSKNGKAKPENSDGVEMPPADNKEEKQKTYTETIRQIVELDGKCMYDEALALLPPVTDYPEKEAEITKRKTELERKSEQKKQLLFI